MHFAIIRKNANEKSVNKKTCKPTEYNANKIIIDHAVFHLLTKNCWLCFGATKIM